MAGRFDDAAAILREKAAFYASVKPIWPHGTSPQQMAERLAENAAKAEMFSDAADILVAHEAGAGVARYDAAGRMAIIGRRKVRVSAEGVAAFNRQWPASTLRDTRAYWFEFDDGGQMVDTDCPESDDGPAALAISVDCQAFLDEGALPDWLA